MPQGWVLHSVAKSSKMMLLPFMVPHFHSCFVIHNDANKIPNWQTTPKKNKLFQNMVNIRLDNANLRLIVEQLR